MYSQSVQLCSPNYKGQEGFQKITLSPYIKALVSILNYIMTSNNTYFIKVLSVVGANEIFLGVYLIYLEPLEFKVTIEINGVVDRQYINTHSWN